MCAKFPPPLQLLSLGPTCFWGGGDWERGRASPIDVNTCLRLASLRRVKLLPVRLFDRVRLFSRVDCSIGKASLRWVRLFHMVGLCGRIRLFNRMRLFDKVRLISQIQIEGNGEKVLCSKSQHLLVNPLFRSDANVLIWEIQHPDMQIWDMEQEQGTIVLLWEFHISNISIWDVSFHIDISEISESFVMGAERRGRGTTLTSTPGFSNFRRVHLFLFSPVLLPSLLLSFGFFNPRPLSKVQAPCDLWGQVDCGNQLTMGCWELALTKYVSLRGQQSSIQSL